LEDVHEEGQEHKTGTSDSAGEDGGVETSSGAEVDGGRANAGGVTVANWGIDVACAAVGTRTVENGNGDEGAHDEEVTDEAEDGEEGSATKAASHERSEESVDDSTASHAFNGLCLLVDALDVELVFNVRYKGSR